MKIAPIINQLVNYLPLYSSNFSERLQVLAVSVDPSNVVTVTTTTDHGLTTGDGIVLQGTEVSLKIDPAACVIDGNKVSFVTLDKHNFVMNFNYKEVNGDKSNTAGNKAIIKLSDFGDDFYDGEHLIYDVPNKNTIVVEFASAPPPIQADTPLCYDGAWYLMDGFHNIQVIDTDEFAFEIPNFLTEAVIKGNMTVDKNMRITGCINNERISDMYTRQPTNDLWAFVTDSSDELSKDRQTQTDAVASRTYGVDYRMQLVDNVSVFLVAPVSDEISGRLGHDQIEDEKINVIKALAGSYYQNPFSSGDQFKINYIGSDLLSYNTSFLIKEMRFQTSCDIVIQDVQRRLFFRSVKQISSTYNKGYVANYNTNEDKT